MTALRKISATAYKDRMHTLSDKSLKRLDENQPGDKMLRKAIKNGSIKRSVLTDILSNNSPAQKKEIDMIAGMNHGTKQILKKNDAVGEIIKGNDALKSILNNNAYETQARTGYKDIKTGEFRVPSYIDFGPHHGEKVFVDTKTRNISRKSLADKIINPFSSSSSSGLDRAHANALVQRHEAYETSAAKKSLGSKRPSGQIFLDSIKPMQTGNHFSGTVLANEARDARRMRNRKIGENVKEVRTNTGERTALQKIIGKDIFKDKLNSSDMKKIDNAKGNYPAGSGVKVDISDVPAIDKKVYNLGLKIGGVAGKTSNMIKDIESLSDSVSRPLKSKGRDIGRLALKHIKSFGLPKLSIDMSRRSMLLGALGAVLPKAPKVVASAGNKVLDDAIGFAIPETPMTKTVKVLNGVNKANKLIGGWRMYRMNRKAGVPRETALAKVYAANKKLDIEGRLGIIPFRKAKTITSGIQAANTPVSKVVNTGSGDGVLNRMKGVYTNIRSNMSNMADGGAMAYRSFT